MQREKASFLMNNRSLNNNSVAVFSLHARSAMNTMWRSNVSPPFMTLEVANSPELSHFSVWAFRLRKLSQEISRMELAYTCLTLNSVLAIFIFQSAITAAFSLTTRRSIKAELFFLTIPYNYFLFFSEFDECKTNKHGCSHICVNTLGGYRCQCEIGYELHPDGKRCEGEWILTYHWSTGILRSEIVAWTGSINRGK